MIREATIDDAMAITEMSSRFHADALEQFGLGFNPSHFIRFVFLMIDSPSSMMAVIDEGGEIKGAIAGVVTPWFADQRQITADELCFWIDPEYRGGGQLKNLIKFFEDWGRDQGASTVRLTAIASSTVEQVKAYYNRHGFTEMETGFIKKI